MEDYMAKKKASVEGEEHASAPVEDQAPAEEATAEVAPAETEVEEAIVEEAAEEVVDEVIEEPVTNVDLVTIKLLAKGPIRGHDGHKIHKDQEGQVVSHLADALVGRGQAEIV